jgi:hypothetical protein
VIFPTVISKIGPRLLGAVVIAGILYAGYRHYTGLLDDLGQLREDRAALAAGLQTSEQSVVTLTEALDDWKRQAEQARAHQEELEQTARRATAENRRLNEIFARHDLTQLARARPGLIESRINDGTERVLGLLACASDPSCDLGDGGAAAGAPAAADAAAD